MLSIDFNLLLTTVVIFLALIYILNLILYKPILRHIDSRNLLISDDESSMQKQNDIIKSCEAEIEKILNDARVEVNAIRNKAIDEATERSNKEIAEKKALLEEEYKAFRLNLEKEVEELKSSLLLQLPEFRSILNRKLSNL